MARAWPRFLHRPFKILLLSPHLGRTPPSSHDFKSLAATVERHARGADAGVFVSKGDYLQIDYYLGRYLTTLWSMADFTASVAKPERPVVVVNQENWDRWHRQLPPGLDVLDTTTVGGEALRLVRAH